MHASTVILLLIVAGLLVFLWRTLRMYGAMEWKLADAHRRIEELETEVKFPTPPILPSPVERDGYYMKLAAYLRWLDELINDPAFEAAARAVEQKALGRS